MKIIEMNNFLITVRAIVTSFLFGMIGWSIMFVASQMPAIALVLGVLWFVSSLFLWGYVFRSLKIGRV